MMKKEGFTTVHFGNLCWQSYEPEDEIYTFDWFGEVMNLFAESGICVFLDVSIRPTPV